MTRLRAAIVLGLAAVTVAACGVYADTNSDQVAVVYHAGDFEDTTFDTCQGTNKNDAHDVGAKVYIYPQGQRTFDFNTNDDKAESDDIPIVTSDNVTMQARGVLNFQLNTDCKTLRQFHERLGLKYGANDQGVSEWSALLRTYLGTPLQDAMKAAARSYTWQALYNDENVKDEFIDAVLKGLPADVKDFAKGDFFQDFTLKVPNIIPPQALLNQFQEQQVQAERLNTINAQAAANAAEVQQIQQLVAVLGPDGYILYRNMQNCEDGNDSTPCIPFLPVPAGGNINVTPGG